MAETDHPPGRIRLTVELERDAQPPSGWIEDEHGERCEFAGLLELISLLDSPGTGPQQRA
jgi:hypothetical protein